MRWVVVRLQQNAVKSEEIAASAVGSSELADGGVTSGKIADGTIVNADIAENALIDFSKISVSASDLQGIGGYTEGKGVSIASGVISIGQSVHITDEVQFKGVVVNGDIGFTGRLLKNGTDFESGAFKRTATGHAYFNESGKSVYIGKSDNEFSDGRRWEHVIGD